MAEKPKTGSAVKAAAATKAELRVDATSRSSLVRVGDKLGLFTPVAEAGEETTSEENLERIVEVLGERVAALESENQDLRQRLARLAAAAERTADDFATAVAHTLDSMQSRLQETHNPVSRFAVRSFDIEATVAVEVTSLGTVSYRFVKPEEDVAPERLSHIRMSLVPTARDGEEGAWTKPAFTPQIDVEEVQGIGEAYQRKLNASNIYTLGDLLTAGTRARSQVELAATLGVDRGRLAEWLSHAELMTVRSVDGRAAEVLHELGYGKLEQLGEAEPDALTERYNTAVTARGQKTHKPIDRATAEEWIATAKAFAGTRSGG